MSEEPGVPPLVTDLAEGCVRYVEQAVGVRLDFTQDTLPILDHYLQMVPDPSQEEIIGVVAPMCGVYFGEVVRRELAGARWHAPESDFEAWRIEFDPCFLHFNPIGMAIEALLRDEVEGWSGQLQVLDADRNDIKAALEQLGEVPEDDYYRLAVRYEVIEHAHAFLTGRAVTTGERNRRFGRDVYRAVLDGPRAGGATH